MSLKKIAMQDTSCRASAKKSQQRDAITRAGPLVLPLGSYYDCRIDTVWKDTWNIHDPITRLLTTLLHKDHSLILQSPLPTHDTCPAQDTKLDLLLLLLIALNNALLNLSTIEPQTL
jgi:hypothetical protein